MPSVATVASEAGQKVLQVTRPVDRRKRGKVTKATGTFGRKGFNRGASCMMAILSPRKGTHGGFAHESDNMLPAALLVHHTPQWASQ